MNTKPVYKFSIDGTLLEKVAPKLAKGRKVRSKRLNEDANDDDDVKIVTFRELALWLSEQVKVNGKRMLNIEDIEFDTTVYAITRQGTYDWAVPGEIGLVPYSKAADEDVLTIAELKAYLDDLLDNYNVADDSINFMIDGETFLLTEESFDKETQVKKNGITIYVQDVSTLPFSMEDDDWDWDEE